MIEECLYSSDKCKEKHCNINKKNIKAIYKPDIKTKKDVPKIDNKACDCIIECSDGKISIVEILCGKLTYREYQDKLKQLESCIKIVKYCDKSKEIKKVVLLYDTIDSRGNPSFKKRLSSPTKISGYNVEFYQNKNFRGIVC